MRPLGSATFKILVLLEFGCGVQKHAIQTNGVNGMPMPNPQNCPFCLGHVDPIYYTHAVADPTHRPKRHADPISRFADRQTNSQTDGHTHTHTERQMG